MAGFFTEKETRSLSRSKGKLHTCIQCGLYKNAITPKMNVQGEGKKGIMIIGTSPTPSEDKSGVYWQTKEGRYLKKVMGFLKVDLDRDCWSFSALRCSAQKDGMARNPAMPELLSCRKMIIQSIQRLQPKVVILMGLSAVNSVIGYSTGTAYDSLDKWRGNCIPDQQLKTYLCPMHHPAEIAGHKSVAFEKIFWMDLKQAIGKAEFQFPSFNPTPNEVKILDTEVEIYEYLKSLKHVKRFAWDLETTGLKPHDTSKHKIGCIGISHEQGKAVAFSMLNLSEKNLRVLRRIFGTARVKKIAQNMKFEHNWFYHILGIDVKGWEWDTMQASHILNNTPGVSGLKFQTYLNFGISGYDESMKPFLQAPNSNATNKVVEKMEDAFVRKDMMQYCGYDAMFTFMLSEVQKPQIKFLHKDAYDLMHKGALALVRAETQGMRVDVEYLQRQKRKMTNRIIRKERSLMKSKFIRQWKHIYGSKFTLGSGTQLAHMLYNVKKLTPPKLTKSGQGATDDEALKLLNMPEMDDLLAMRKLLKVRDTYMEGFLREQVDGVIHPFFNLHTVRTFRSSSDAPNFQNIPKRDKEIKKIIRSSIYPRKGYQLMEADFSKLEVSISACYHEDPKMMDYLTSDKNDMHGDLAEQIFKIKNFDKHKPEHGYLRAAAKNGFIFPQFYGDYYGNNAVDLLKWAQLPKSKWKPGMGVKISETKHIAEHLISKGIKNLEQFTNHLKKIEDDFWGVRFAAYKQWKDEWIEEYGKFGYFRSKTGFTFGGVMGKNDIINYPVQGAAFHCLLWSFIEIDRISKEEGWKTRLIGQIHDALVLDVHPDELAHVAATVKRVTTIDLPNAWKWINVPLQIEAEVAPVDASWNEVEDYVFD